MLRANQAFAVIFFALGVVLLIATTIESVQHGFGLSVGYIFSAIFFGLAYVRWRALRPRQ